jgi:hypothetical protein
VGGAAGRSGEELACPVEEVTEATGLSRSLICDEMNAGRLGYLKVGRRRIVTGRIIRRSEKRNRPEAAEESESAAFRLPRAYRL